MTIRNIIRFFLMSVLFVLNGLFSYAQFVKTVYEYMPAPGQYTNSEQIGRPAAAQSIIGGLNGLVSLGGYGGYIIVGFEQSIENDPANPYGVDFTIFGNATLTWSEAGGVQVMRDDNGNGLPDDTWYEIAGSDHFFSNTKYNYEITYVSPGDGIIDDINWSDNLGRTGIIVHNSYHQQPYYPASTYFPGVNTGQLTFSGTLLFGNVDLSLPAQVVVHHRTFGYADNTKINSFSENLPDNPYTAEIEGSGGDAIDISWARDGDGDYVDLDKIDFVRVYTAMNDKAGWLGEISTEIAGIRDVAPQTVEGNTKIIVIEDLPVSILKDETIQLNAHYFLNGKPVDEQYEWNVDNPDYVKIEERELTALKSGTIILSVRLSSDHTVFAEHQLKIVSVGNAHIDLSSTAVQKNDRLKLTGEITDDEGEPISGMTGEWISGNTDIFSIIEEDGQAYLLALNEGQAWLYFQEVNNSDIIDSVEISVLAESDFKKVYVSVKTEETTVFPRQSLNVGLFNLNPFVDDRTGDYSIQAESKISLAHVVAEVFKEMQLADDFRFRDNEKGNSQLYIWKLPEEDEGSTAFYYGYGGSREQNYKRTWLVKVNQQMEVTDLDKTLVNNGDEILIYHVSDNSENWQLTQLTSDNDSINKNETVEIQQMQFECNMDAERQVFVISSGVVAGENIQVQDGETKQTDEFGKVTFSFAQSGDYYIVSGIDKLKLNVSGTTGINNMSQQEFSVYPNPAHRKIFISSHFQNGLVELFDYSGRKVLCHELENQNSLDISSLKSGIYIVRLSSGTKIVQQKLIKQ